MRSFTVYVFNSIFSLSKTDLDIGEDWVDSEGESELCDYATEKLPAEIVNKAERKQSQTIRIVPDQRKSSTGSQVHFTLNDIVYYLNTRYTSYPRQYQD